MILKKNLLFLFCVLCETLFSQQRKQPVSINTKDDYTHQWTKTAFPVLWSGFQREDIRSYDSKYKEIGITYVQQISKKKKTVLTIYIYPKNTIDNQSLRDEFYSYGYALNRNSNTNVEIHPKFGNISNDNLKVNYIYSIFSNSMGQPDFFKGVKYVNKNSLLSIYECGGWTFKTRVSSDEMTDDQLLGLKEKVENYFGILQVASVKTLPIDKVPDVVLSPIVKRDSMMTNATIEASQAKIEWMRKNLDKKEVLTGLNDMQIDSEVYATEKMVEYYKAHEKDWELNTDTKKYFTEMIKIVENGKTKDHIYEKYHTIVNYPEGESQKESYVQFKLDQDISENTNEIFYKLFYELE